jgi:hypothetical protein
MSEPLVSVIIPTYNRFEFLLNAIKSVKAQTYSNIEIIHNTSGNYLSCMQSIIFYYMTQVTSRGRYTSMNILELYKIMHQYDKVDYVDSHDEYMKELDIIDKAKVVTGASFFFNLNLNFRC